MHYWWVIIWLHKKIKTILFEVSFWSLPVRELYAYLHKQIIVVGDVSSQHLLSGGCDDYSDRTLQKLRISNLVC